MVDLAGAVQAFVDHLNAAGVRATQDGRDANPPCLLLRPPTMNFRFGKGCWDAEFTAWAMVPATGQTMSLKAAGDLITAAQEALDDIAVTATPTDVTTADGATVPAYSLTWTHRIPA